MEREYDVQAAIFIIKNLELSVAKSMSLKFLEKVEEYKEYIQRIFVNEDSDNYDLVPFVFKKLEDFENSERCELIQGKTIIKNGYWITYEEKRGQVVCIPSSLLQTAMKKIVEETLN